MSFSCLLLCLLLLLYSSFFRNPACPLPVLPSSSTATKVNASACSEDDLSRIFSVSRLLHIYLHSSLCNFSLIFSSYFFVSSFKRWFMERLIPSCKFLLFLLPFSPYLFGFIFSFSFPNSSSLQSLLKHTCSGFIVCLHYRRRVSSSFFS